jgi:hypothetical protein
LTSRLIGRTSTPSVAIQRGLVRTIWKIAGSRSRRYLVLSGAVLSDVFNACKERFD